MPAGTKWLNLTLPVAAFLGSAAGSVAVQRFLTPPPLSLPPGIVALAAPAQVPPGVPFRPAPPWTPLPDGSYVARAVPGAPGAFNDAVSPVPPSPADPAPAPDGAPVVGAGHPVPFDEREEMLGPVNVTLPHGYFDLPPAPTGPDAPPLLHPGLMIQVEVLEALPGRPIGGERLIRADGTISLGFYGDLRVAGLNRDQAKVRLLEHLHKFLTDQVLGLCYIGPDDKMKIKPAVESDRVYIDETIYYDPNTARPVPATPEGHRVDRRVEANNPFDKTMFGRTPEPPPAATAAEARGKEGSPADGPPTPDDSLPAPPAPAGPPAGAGAKPSA